MLFKRLLFQKQINLSNFIKFNFASYDPYYILGVDRRADFAEIKKAYYKLAAQFHPDKNPSADAVKQFLLIKESYESIKQQKGKAVKMDFEKSEKKKGFQSVRPNADDYKEDFNKEEKKMDNDKYGEYAHRASGDAQYENIKESLNTLYDMNNIKFRGQDIELPDPSKRFKMDEKTQTIKNFSDGSAMFMGIAIMLFGVAFYFLNQAHNKTIIQKYQGLLQNMMNKQEVQAEIEQDEEKSLEEMTEDLSKKKDYKKFVHKIEQQQKIQQLNRQNKVPMIQNFYTSEQIMKQNEETENDE